MKFEHDSTIDAGAMWLIQCATEEEILLLNNQIAKRTNDWGGIIYRQEELDGIFSKYTPSEILLTREGDDPFSVDDAFFRWDNGALCSSNDIRKLLYWRRTTTPYHALLEKALFDELPKRLQCIIETWDANGEN